MQIFNENSSRKKIGILKELPFRINVQPNIPGALQYYSGHKYHVGCLSCINPRCMKFSNSEINCTIVSGFPEDKSVSVCPVDAISWDREHDIPRIDTSKCINCGICISRCPVGALYYDNQVCLNTNKTIATEYIFPTEENRKLQLTQISQLISTQKFGSIIIASDKTFEKIYDKLYSLKNANHNLIGRNLLIALGCHCSTRRIGDVYTRMDAIYSSVAGSFGAVEIEFGRETLDASRGILEDIAVLNTRYGINKYNNKALVICLQLPNARQGYWQVVKDINTVEHIKIGTLTIGSLMLLLWNGCRLEPENDRYYIDYDNMNLRQIICNQLNCKNINIEKRKLGILEPQK